MIYIISSSRYKVHKKELESFMESLYSTYNISFNSVVNIAFVGKRKMREIATTYKNEDVALPVLAFPYKEENIEDTPLLGEIVLCYPQVVLLAAERRKKLDDMMNILLEHGFKNLLK